MEEENKNVLNKSFNPTLVGIFTGTFVYDVLHKELEKHKISQAKDMRIKLKFFKIEVERTFWRKKIRYIQRDVPLTDEQLDEMLK